MPRPVIKKQPTPDRWDVNIDYTDDAGTAYTISSLSVTATNQSDEDITDEVIETSFNSTSGNRAKVWIKGGVQNDEFEVAATATMTTGQIRTERFIVVIDEES